MSTSYTPSFAAQALPLLPEPGLQASFRIRASAPADPNDWNPACAATIRRAEFLVGAGVMAYFACVQASVLGLF